MWVIRAYNPEDDELVLEQELPNATLPALMAALGFVPSPHGSTPLGFAELERLGPGIPMRPDIEYFLDFDVDPDDFAAGRIPDAATAGA